MKRFIGISSGERSRAWLGWTAWLPCILLAITGLDLALARYWQYSLNNLVGLNGGRLEEQAWHAGDI